MTVEEIKMHSENILENFKDADNINEGFVGRFQKCLKEKNIEPEEFEDETGLSHYTYERWLIGKTDPSMKNLVAFCLAFDFDYNAFMLLMRDGNYTINFKNKTHYAYTYLLTDCRGKSITDCNKILKEIGVIDRNLLPIPKREKPTRK